MFARNTLIGLSALLVIGGGWFTYSNFNSADISSKIDTSANGTVMTTSDTKPIPSSLKTSSATFVSIEKDGIVVDIESDSSGKILALYDPALASTIDTLALSPNDRISLTYGENETSRLVIVKISKQ